MKYRRKILTSPCCWERQM